MSVPLSSVFSAVHHVELTVSDRERSVGFYSSLGFAPALLWQEDAQLCAAGLGVPGADIRLAQLRGYGITLELIEFVRPRGHGGSPPPQQVGTAHLALTAADIDAAYEACVAHGLEVVSPPVREQSADWFQLRDPDGIRVEVVSPHAPGSKPRGAIVPESAAPRPAQRTEEEA